MYILKLLHNIVSARIEALFISGNKFLYACVREVCRLGASFRQLITVEVLQSQPVLQLGKQMVVTWSNIRAIRRVVKLLPVEMFKCEQLYVDTHCHEGALHAFCSERSYTVFLMFHNTLLTLLWSLVA
jgi:hypothetical protein